MPFSPIGVIIEKSPKQDVLRLGKEEIKMAKSNSVFVCENCGAQSPKWIGKCPTCGKWNTYVEEFTEEEPKKGAKITAPRQKPTPLGEVKQENFARVKSGIKELDGVLGGGIVPGSLVLVGGEPGVGKSTLLTQLAGNLAKTQKVLYASGEESCSQVKMRCDRLGVKAENLSVLNETVMESILLSAKDYDYLIVDSIQAVFLEELNSSAGSVGQVKECAARLMRFAKSTGVTVFIVGQVTKEGAIAGPKVLEHIMDTVLYFEGEVTGNYKVLRAVKNRFGSVSEVGVFEMREKGIFGVEDYAGIFLSATRGEAAGSVVTPFLSGNRCVPVEIQCLTAKSVYGMPRRMPLGIDYNKLVLLLAVLEKRAGVPFYTYDVYMNAVGGMKVDEPAADLAVALAAVSAARNTAVEKHTAVFGEVGLTGEIRPVHFAESRIAACKKLGFNRIVLPKGNYAAVKDVAKDVELVPVSYLWQAVKALFPENGN